MLTRNHGETQSRCHDYYSVGWDFKKGKLSLEREGAKKKKEEEYELLWSSHIRELTWKDYWPSLLSQETVLVHNLIEFPLYEKDLFTEIDEKREETRCFLAVSDYAFSPIIYSIAIL